MQLVKSSLFVFSSPTGHAISSGSFYRLQNLQYFVDNPLGCQGCIKKTYNTQPYLPISLHRTQNGCFGEWQTKILKLKQGKVAHLSHSQSPWNCVYFPSCCSKPLWLLSSYTKEDILSEFSEKACNAWKNTFRNYLKNYEITGNNNT